MGSFAQRAARSARDPWLVLTSVFGGGVAWAVGLGPVGLAVAGGMFAVGSVVGGLVQDGRRGEGEIPLPDLNKGSEQAALVANLGTFVTNLKALRNQPKPEVVVDPSIEALVAAQNAYDTAVRVAAAIDGLDLALDPKVPTSDAIEVSQAIQRMTERRGALLGKLHGTVDEVAEVYTKLLEMSATVQALDVGAGADDEVEKVNASLDSLRTTLADLEKQDIPATAAPVPHPKQRGENRRPG